MFTHRGFFFLRESGWCVQVQQLTWFLLWLRGGLNNPESNSWTRRSSSRSLADTTTHGDAGRSATNDWRISGIGCPAEVLPSAITADGFTDKSSRIGWFFLSARGDMSWLLSRETVRAQPEPGALTGAGQQAPIGWAKVDGNTKGKGGKKSRFGPKRGNIHFSTAEMSSDLLADPAASQTRSLFEVHGKPGSDSVWPTNSLVY